MEDARHDLAPAMWQPGKKKELTSGLEPLT